MFSNVLTRVVALFLIVGLLGGCAEIDRRGGVIDQIEDTVLFRADTKSHRLLRSYLLMTVLLTAARRQGHNDVDSTAIAGALEGALAIANEAYMCLYPGLYEFKDPSKPTYPADSSSIKMKSGAPDEIISWNAQGQIVAINIPMRPKWCQFFDEKMARLDYALYRLASVTLFNSESRQTLADIQTKLIGKIPVVSDTVAAAIHANKAVNQVTTIIDDLLNLAFTSAGLTLALLPLYRDSLELNMWVVADNFAIACKDQNPLGTFTQTEIESNANCVALVNTMKLLQRGNGSLKPWRDYLGQLNTELEQDPARSLMVEAYRPHFFLVSQLLVRSCRHVLSDGLKPKRCETVLTDALETAAFQADNATGNLITNGGPPTPSRWMTVSLPLPGAQLAMRSPRRAKPADPQATGSVPVVPRPAAQPQSAVPAVAPPAVAAPQPGPAR